MKTIKKHFIENLSNFKNNTFIRRNRTCMETYCIMYLYTLQCIQGVPENMRKADFFTSYMRPYQ